MDRKLTQKKLARPTWNIYFIATAVLISQRSTCLRRKVGAILVKEKRILATGYNGAPSGIVHCAQVGCIRQQKKIASGERHELCRGLHAEQNVILQAAYHGIGVKNSVMYITHSPCSICAKMIINAGIKEVICLTYYPDRMAEDFLSQAGVKMKKLGKIYKNKLNQLWRQISEYEMSLL